MDFGFDVIWLCSSFLTCMCAQTHLQVHRNFAQMQLVLVLMIDNLWGCSWLIKLSSPFALRGIWPPYFLLYTYTILYFKRVAVVRLACCEVPFVPLVLQAQRLPPERRWNMLKSTKRRPGLVRPMRCSFTPLYCGMSGVCSELFAHEVMSNITLSPKKAFKALTMHDRPSLWSPFHRTSGQLLAPRATVDIPCFTPGTRRRYSHLWSSALLEYTMR